MLYIALASRLGHGQSISDMDEPLSVSALWRSLDILLGGAVLHGAWTVKEECLNHPRA